MEIFTENGPSIFVDQIVTEQLRDIIRAELRKQRVKVRHLSQRTNITYARLTHMLKMEKPMPIPAEDLALIRQSLGMPSSWPYDAFQQYQQSPPSIKETITPYGIPCVIPGSSHPDVIPEEFLKNGWQILVMPDDSMMFSLAPGDILAIQPMTKLRFGYPHAVVVDGIPTVRMIDHNGREVVVVPKNPSYSASLPDVPVIGVVVGRLCYDGNGDRISRINTLGLKL